jgi:hypothetical protein
MKLCYGLTSATGLYDLTALTRLWPGTSLALASAALALTQPDLKPLFSTWPGLTTQT